VNAILSPRTQYAIAAFLFVATAAVTLWQNAHLAILWDLSYLLDSAYRIALGQIPYRDFPFAHAPLTFLIQAAILRLTGRVYIHHISYAAIAGATATLLTWRILTQLLRDRLQHADLIATLLVTPLTVLGIYSIYPHPIYDSDCALAILIAIYLLQRTTAATPLRSITTGAALIPPLFFKQNIGLLFLITSLAAIIAIAIANRLNRKPIRSELYIIIGATITLTLALITIHLTVGLQNYLYWTITFAAQRRLPGLGTILTIYHQTSLLWTIPSAVAAVIILHRSPTNRWMKPAALFLLIAPFLWTIVTLPFLEDPSDRADQILSLWPHLLLLAALLALYNLRRTPTFNSLLPLILLATIHGTFLSQQLWGSTYSAWPFLTLLLASLLTTVPTIATPLTAIITATFLICGTPYTFSHERLSYTRLTGPLAHATLPQLHGLATPGPWIPNFEELIRYTNQAIPPQDAIILLPGQDPFYYATGRTPLFPVLLFDPATDPYTPQQTLEAARAHNVRWLIVNRNLQLTADPIPNLPDYLHTLQQDFILDHTLINYDIYRLR
jgi:hypothetical protein